MCFYKYCSSDLHVKNSTGIGNLSLPINVLIGVIPMVGSASWESLLGFFLFFFNEKILMLNFKMMFYITPSI